MHLSTFIACEPQPIVEIEEHRFNPDFGFYYLDSEYKHEHELYVDCDGHFFHEKTKEQAAYRNDRDYIFNKASIDLIHFTGSEIYNDPFQCVEKILNFINTNRWGKARLNE